MSRSGTYLIATAVVVDYAGWLDLKTALEWVESLEDGPYQEALAFSRQYLQDVASQRYLPEGRYELHRDKTRYGGARFPWEFEGLEWGDLWRSFQS